MTLDDAYQALGLKTPWDHEERIRERHEQRYAKELQARPQQSYDRAIGSTQHMLIELYLDVEKANRTVSPMLTPKISFLVVTLHRDMAEELKRKLTWLHSQLKLYVNLEQVRFVPHNMADSLRGRKFPSWGVFCDNSVNENVAHRDRPTGPFRYIRKLVAQTMSNGTKQYEAYDRDDSLLCTLTDSEINEILKDAECPIVLNTGLLTPSSLHYKPVAYPAYSEEPFLTFIHHKAPFDV